MCFFVLNCSLATNVQDFAGKSYSALFSLWKTCHDEVKPELLVRELGWAHCFDVQCVHLNSVTYLDLRGRNVPAIVVALELIFGFDEGSFGLGNSGCDSVVELVDGFDS
jgi:hypothetical protein